MVTVLSVGGSIVAPDQPDVEFLTRFSKMIREWLSKDSSRKLILVIGGGGPARIYQQAYKILLNRIIQQYKTNRQTGLVLMQLD